MTFTVHTDWETAGFGLAPIVESVGPFPAQAMLRAWWETCGQGELMLVESSEALVPLQRDGTTIRLLGESDLFDYHAPLGSGSGELVAEWARQLAPGTTVDFDSLPAGAADVLMKSLDEAGMAPVADVHESAAVLDLPGDYENYLAGLDKKQRHETRRKGRRFADTLGPPRLERRTGADAIARFSEMHRLADGRKGQFMTPKMEDLFARLATDAGGSLDFLYGSGPEPVAAAFGFEDAEAYYLYNSAFDPVAGAASPGIVLVSELIRQAVESGKARFDFLKGDEVYKYRLGASARPLWRVRAVAKGAN